MLQEITQTIQSSLLEIIGDAVSFLPRLIVGLVILLIGYIIARVLRWVIVRVGERLKLNEAIDRVGAESALERVGIEQTPVQIGAGLVFWVVMLNFLLAAFTTMGLREAAQPIEGLIAFLPRLIGGLIVLIIGAAVAQFIGRAVSSATESIGIEFHQTLGSLVQLIMMGIVFLIVIQQMGLDTTLPTQLYTVFITMVLVGVAIAFGLGGRSVAQNVLAGYYARETFTVGDTVEIGGERGTLVGIGSLNSEVQLDDSVLTVPNSALTEGSVKLTRR